MLGVFFRSPNIEVEIEKARILDFYVVFPFLLSEFRFPPGRQKWVKHARTLENKYETVPDPKRLFLQMAGIQIATLRNLAEKEMIDPERLSAGYVASKRERWSAGVSELMPHWESVDPLSLDCITQELFLLPLYGRDGLKARSGLMEFRYDAV